MSHPLLDSINSPADLRALQRDQLPQLADELRAFLLESVSKTGGHLSSNLGTVELDVYKRQDRPRPDLPQRRAVAPHRLCAALEGRPYPCLLYTSRCV